MDETVKPLRIPPQMSVYADGHGVFHLAQSMVSSLVIDQPDDVISYLISLLRRSSVDNVYHQIFIRQVDDVVARRLEKGRGLSDRQHLAALQRFRCEVTGLRSAYQHVLKIVNSDQPHVDVYQQGPDDLVLQVLEKRLSQVDCSCRGWILHGFPRDLQQARSLQESQHQPNRVYFLELTDDVCVERLTLRATDPLSGERSVLFTHTTVFTWTLIQDPDQDKDLDQDLDPKPFFLLQVSHCDSTGSELSGPEQTEDQTRGQYTLCDIHSEPLQDTHCCSAASTAHVHYMRCGEGGASVTHQEVFLTCVVVCSKKQRAEKRKCGSSSSSSAVKQRRLQQEEEEPEAEAPPPADSQAPPPEATWRAAPPKKKKRAVVKEAVKETRKEGVKEAGKETRKEGVKSSIKTSSLFRHNPDIPEILSLQSVRPKISRSDGPLAVIIVPTREPFTWIVPGVLMGGEKRKAEKARLRKGINILVSTPGRLVDHIQHTLSIVFSSVRWLILDEADRTLDLGFEKDLTVILNSLNSAGERRQNVLLSATLTHGVTRLADVCLNDPVDIHGSGPASSSLPPLSADPCDLAPADQSESFAVPEALQQFVVLVPSKIRLVCLAAFLLDKCQNNKVIVFVSSCEVVEFLHLLFTSVLSGTSANRKPPPGFLRLHGNMKQEERSEVFQKFSVSQSGVLLCTVNILSDSVTFSGEVRLTCVGEAMVPSGTSWVQFEPVRVQLGPVLTCQNTGAKYQVSPTSSRALEQEIRERATVLQTNFENFVHADAQSLQNAKKALQSFLRAYTTYPSHLKHIFHIRSLHLGHTAKSFGLRDAPQSLSSAPKGPRAKHHSKDRNQNQNQNQTRSPEKNQNKKTNSSRAGVRRFCPGQREVGLLRSEFSSGLEEDANKKKRQKKKKKTIGLS
ncbi:hypothetical protein F2P81_025136 [Scophthalmus maximus]|uniref:ATP-dependent RNA helicase n=1 Tax=Scophthalmus maximus TaxID=52904 RepID=A0A6A4RT22_SCOMX|nr:hypothetical protein F2P81_025136 [Scophthalmus maximus]